MFRTGIRLMAAGVIVATIGAGIPASAFPTEHVEITVAVTANDGYAATVTAKGASETETFNIDVVRVTSSVAPKLVQVSNTKTAIVPPDAGAETDLPATFVVHIVGGQRATPDNVFDAYALVTACSTDTSCTSSPVLVSLG